MNDRSEPLPRYSGTGGDEVRLPRPPGLLRRWVANHGRAVDITIVVVYLFGCALAVLLDLIAGTADPEPFAGIFLPDLPGYLTWPWILVALFRAAAVATALLFRRRFPLIGLAVVTVMLFGEQGAQTLPNSVAIWFMLYAVPVYRSVPAGWVGYAIAVAGYSLQVVIDEVWGPFTLANPGGILTAEAAAADRDPIVIAVGIFMTALWYLAIVLVAINLGNRRRYLSAIIDRAHQLARERDQLAQLAVAEERSRIAREMHDIVAHSVSVMIALSEGAARVAGKAPDAAADAMERSAETGRTALAEMRRLLGALTEPAASEVEYVPQPGVDELPELIRGFTDAGIQPRLTVLGSAAGDRGQDLAVYRIVQEGLTNVLRYAGPGARVDVTVDRSADSTDVTVRDFGVVPGGPGPLSGVGSGRGLRGLEERVRVFGGHIESGPVPGGGWQLRAVLPVSADARERPRPDAVEAESPEAPTGSPAPTAPEPTVPTQEEPS
ncbi:two-component sensor histidine kinase [Leucobacter sp. Psy1]|uniref:sensor histidine kinase n=1 Tax=Leucobacter sp. Psy1 TaxID=2875729 RepID=UPI001CD2367B|nr:histidine kinase [Leucobacter sp. Psy1]UBH07268.1 two-component sensor histidine kinase [Leucobacter sp. Psy1]